MASSGFNFTHLNDCIHSPLSQVKCARCHILIRFTFYMNSMKNNQLIISIFHIRKSVKLLFVYFVAMLWKMCSYVDANRLWPCIRIQMLSVWCIWLLYASFSVCHSFKYQNNSNLMLYSLRIDNLHMQFVQYMWSNVVLLEVLPHCNEGALQFSHVILYYKHLILYASIEHWLKSTFDIAYWFYYDTSRCLSCIYLQRKFESIASFDILYWYIYIFYIQMPIFNSIRFRFVVFDNPNLSYPVKSSWHI